MFGLEPDHLDALLANDARFQKYPRAPAAVIRGADVRDWGELADYLRESYALVAAAKSKRSGRARPKPGRRA